MIHQHIFASPKPGMTEAAFQDYWLNVHAVKFASKIPQIVRYKIDLRLDWTGERPNPIWNGIAEIWLRNEAEQLASMQTPEFLDGARRDEPAWAAFWNTLGLDTGTHVIRDTIGDAIICGRVKLTVLQKRREGIPLAEFRRISLEEQSPAAAECPGVLRHDLCLARDSLYATGESRFDAVGHYWFENSAAFETAIADPLTRALILPSDGRLLVPRYVIPMLTSEHWVIGPQPRG